MDDRAHSKRASTILHPPPLTLQLSQQERRETHMSLSGGLRDRGGYRGVGTDERSDALGEGVDNRDEIDVD